MAKPRPINRPSTIIADLIYFATNFGELPVEFLEIAHTESKRYERRAKRRVSLASGGDPARV